MIKIHFSKSEFDKFAGIHKDRVRTKLRTQLESFKKEPSQKGFANIYIYIIENLDTVLAGDLPQLEEHILQIERMILNIVIHDSKYSYVDFFFRSITDKKLENWLKDISSKKKKKRNRKKPVINDELKTKIYYIKFGNKGCVKKIDSEDYRSIFKNSLHSKILIKLKLKHKSYKKKIFITDGSHLFDYNGSANWVLKMLKDLNINTCLYCNRQYISVSGSKKFGTTMDHFYDKATYPYLALSFYNLIPSCYSCNSQMKNKKDFSLSTHLHPYEKGFEEILHFKTDINNLDDILDKDKSDFRIILDEYKIKTPNANDLKRAKRNVEDFLLEDQYQIHQKEVKDLLDLGLKYLNSSNIFFEGWKDLFSDKDEAIRIMFNGVLTNKENLHERTLSKLKRDIAMEYFGDIFSL